MIERRTLKRREASRQDQFKIAKLSLAQEQCWELVGLGCELSMSRRISGEQVFEFSSVWWVGHDYDMRKCVVEADWGLRVKWYEQERKKELKESE